jgi:hypothetical protein
MAMAVRPMHTPTTTSVFAARRRNCITIDMPTIAVPITAANVINGTASSNPNKRRFRSDNAVTSIAGSANARSRTWIGLTGRPTSATSRGAVPDASAGTMSLSHRTAKRRLDAIK